jgi:probable HAF family extracellular repeat protein
MTALPTLGGPDDHAAFAINATGVIVGQSETTLGKHRAVRWVNGAITDLGDLGGGMAFATGINDLGDIVGGSRLA